MKYVILSNKIIPGYNVKGPIMSPAEYDPHLVMRWVLNGLDIREVMEDGSYRKIERNDERVMNAIHNKTEKKINEHKSHKQQVVTEVKPHVNVRLKPEKPLKKSEPVKKQEEPKPEVKMEEPVKEKDVDELFIDDLEKPE